VRHGGMALPQKVGGNSGISSVQLRGSGDSSWTDLVNIWGAEWEASQTPTPPMDIHITEEGGAEVGWGVPKRH
jgi:Expansin C-terminal domain